MPFHCNTVVAVFRGCPLVNTLLTCSHFPQGTLGCVLVSSARVRVQRLLFFYCNRKGVALYCDRKGLALAKR